MITDLNLSLTHILELTVLLALVIELLIMVRSFKADHLRRKRQATMEFLNEDRFYRAQLGDILRQKLNTSILEQAEPLDPLALSVEDHKVIREHLSFLENLAVGIRNDVFDFMTVRRLKRSSLQQWYRLLRPYIQDVRNQSRQKRYYRDFEWLAKRV